MKIALVHDFLTQYGGAERFLEAVCLFFSGHTIAIYTLKYSPEKFPASWVSYTVKSLAWNLPKIDYYPQLYAYYLVPLMEQLDLSEYDLVFSSDLLFAKHVIVPPHIPHISYHHTPAANLYPIHINSSITGLFNLSSSFHKSYLRIHDYLSSQRIDKVLTNSGATASRIRKYYGRNAEVIYSFVDIPSQEQFTAAYSDKGEYYICISRLVPQKRIDLAVVACSNMNIPLVVVGEGIEKSRLEQIAGPCVKFTGFVPDNEKNNLIGKSKGLIFPGVEDLGLVPLEAMAWGKGVVAFNQGGVIETVVANETGVYFEEQTVASLVNALRRFDLLEIKPDACRARAHLFSRKVFNQRLQKVVDEVVSKS